MSYSYFKFNEHHDWLEFRSKGIGSSEVGTILGLNPYETPYQLWMRKTGRAPAKAENTAMRMGHVLEPIVAQLYAEETGAEIDKESEGDWIAQDENRSYLRVSPDRLYYPTNQPKIDENRGILECKTTVKEIDPTEPPMYWYAQLQYQMMVMEINHGALAWLVSGREFGHSEYERNDDYCKFMLEKIDEFWHKHIIEGIAPDIETSADAALKFPKELTGKVASATNETEEAYSQLLYVKSQIKTLTDEKEKLENVIRVAFEDAEILQGSDGKTIATYKTSKSSKKFDEKTFAQAYPELHEGYMRTVEGTRRLLIK